MEERTTKSNSTFKLGALLAVSFLFWPTMALGDLSVIFYDNFDDGNYDGWTVTPRPWSGGPSTGPDVVSSPQGYARRGVGSGYSQDPGLRVHIETPFSVSNVGSLKIEMRATSGSQWPNMINLFLYDGSDYYRFTDYGEANRRVDFFSYINGQEYVYMDSLGARAYEWHDFAGTRDTAGWWSLSIDGVPEVVDFHQDLQLTSFEGVGLQFLRNQSEVEWL